MLSIGEFARASGLTAKALRLYDELDLLTPAAVDQHNGYRYYTDDQVEQARLVARLRSAAVPLPRIAAIIRAATPQAAADEVLSYWRHVETDRASAREVITSLVALLKGQDNTMALPEALNLSLGELIAGVYEDHPDADDLTRIAEARRRARALTDLGEQLVDHYVSEAKLSGASWGEIGDALGVSDKSAERARTSDVFARYTNLNRHCIVLAQEAARTHKHDLIGTEHLLLGLLSEPRGLAYDVLTAHDTSEQQVRDAIETALPAAGEQAIQGHIAFGPDSKESIKETLRAAGELGHDWVGTEHTLLGLIRVKDSGAAQILRGLGFTSDALHETIKAEIAARLAE
ncbi:DNA-binding transcriptional MerR regulator [Kribbella aluminosa]|uniref:DNA-binding transcriptional MerR regulator n=1 Tax=Kribbella aluminosa TaxID=416017 RepID=A0ABS4UML0_9ACTN|nr:Clp protease N-terminal domain-containing protein [Kribbella aluminosa]MBP2352860.1 DNA-binding transcriptional MerR regulator [Kribbella aluminosa]